MSASEVRVVYDGACPLCRVSVRRLRSRSAQVRFTLIDARTDPAGCRELALLGFDLNDGIAMQANERRYSGAAAAHALALMHRPSGLADRAALWCFGSPRRAACFYPLFEACRKILLMVLNRSPL